MKNGNTAKFRLATTDTKISQHTTSVALRETENIDSSQKFIIRGMTCSACAMRIEKVTNRLSGVSSTHVNLPLERAYVRYNPAVSTEQEIIMAIQKAGYEAYVDIEERADVVERLRQRAFESLYNRWIIALVLTACLMLEMFLSMRLGHALLPVWCTWGIATLVQILVGTPFYRGAINAIRGMHANMDVLVSLGASVSYIDSSLRALHGETMASFDGAAMILVMVTFGKILETQAKRRVAAKVRNQQVHPSITAHKIQSNTTTDIPAEMLVPGDEVYLVAPEFVPTDVIVLNQTITVDESILTGESIPITKMVGDPVYGGSRILTGSGLGLVTRTTDDTLHAHTIHSAEEAQMEQSSTRAWVDRVTTLFVPIVILLAIATWVIHWSNGQPHQAIVDAIAVLVAACPCALGLATPTALAVGLNIGLSRGICLQNEHRLAKLQRIDTLVFDKTGTLTTGKLAIVEIETQPSIGIERLISLAASVEDGVDHPIAHAIVRFARQHRISWQAKSPVTATSSGISSRVNGHQIFVGQVDSTAVRVKRNQLLKIEPNNNHHHLRWVDVVSDGVWLGRVWLGDDIRPEAKKMVHQLQIEGIDIWILSGDHVENVQRVANELQIEKYHGQFSASEKQAFIHNLRYQGRTVAMVGDGLNDAPALSTADVGIAFGAASAESLKSSDIAILSGNLNELIMARQLAKNMFSKIHQNLVWAVIYNVLTIPLAFLGVLSPVVAGMGMAFSSLLVISNSMLLQKMSKA